MNASALLTTPRVLVQLRFLPLLASSELTCLVSHSQRVAYPCSARVWGKSFLSWPYVPRPGAL